MDWSNEPYVRLYTRDTTNWKRIGWQGRCVLTLLLRKVDRAGTLDLEGLEPWEAVKLHIDVPDEVAREGVAALLRVETLVVRGNLLVLPNHIEAQEASKSDRQRQRESRQRRASGDRSERDEASRNVTVTHDASRAQNQRDDVSQNVTPPNGFVTERHDQSRAVTNGHSLLNSALHSSAVQGGETAPARAAPPRAWSAERQSAVFQREFHRVFETVPTMVGKTVGSFHASVAQTAELQQRDPEELFVEVVRRWMSKQLTEVELRAPYACFATAWGQLTAKGSASPGANDPEAMFAEARSLIAKGEKERGLALQRRASELAGKDESNVARVR